MLGHDERDDTAAMFVPNAEESERRSAFPTPSFQYSGTSDMRGGEDFQAGVHEGNSTLEEQGSSEVVARANGLVGAAVSALISLARFVLKPGGRLVFFLPLRGKEARVHTLPPTVAAKLCECSSRGEQLSIVFASKQRFTSPNMCRWLIVMEKNRREQTSDMVTPR